MRVKLYRKISVLSLALLAVSVVTAALVPHNSDKKLFVREEEGSLTLTSDDGDNSSVTCNPDSDSNISQGVCTATSQLGNSATSGMSGKPNPNTSNNGKENDDDSKNNTTDCE